MDKVTVMSNTFRGGLGTIISHLSMLLNNDFFVEIHTTSQCSILLHELKNSLMIKNLEIIENNVIKKPQEDIQINDLNKFLSPYLTTDCISYQGKQFPLRQGINKQAIALACYNNSYNVVDYKDRRYYTPEEYGLIFSLLKTAGFEILNLDGLYISMADKIYLMNTYCRAVISYEGGLAHLAHVLQIPSIILPWNTYVSTREPRSVHPNDNWAWRLHLDEKTLFLENITDILKWDSKMLHEQLDKLDQKKGNNPFLQSSVTYKLHEDQIMYINQINGYDTCYQLQLTDYIPSQSFEFAKRQNPNLKIGGLKEIKNS
jgi:hypothetical protein